MIHRSAIAGSLCGAVLLLLCPAARAAQQCTPEANCAKVTVGSADKVPRNGTGTIPLSFSQSPTDDGQANQGNDDIAAIALTLGIPGTGTGTPLSLASCADSDSDGVPDAVHVNAALAGFKVVIENADCTNRNRCLCPGAGQTRDDFINIVVYGPKDLSAPVEIPKLPNGELMEIDLKVSGDAPDGDIDLHVFSQTDNGVQKPQFAAQLSIGDKSAIDQTCQGNCADAGDISKIIVQNGTLNVMGAITPPVGCIGDCNHDGHVSTDELVVAVSIALAMKPMDACPAIDENTDGTATVDEVVNSVDKALNGCN